MGAQRTVGEGIGDRWKERWMSGWDIGMMDGSATPLGSRVGPMAGEYAWWIHSEQQVDV